MGLIIKIFAIYENGWDGIAFYRCSNVEIKIQILFQVEQSDRSISLECARADKIPNTILKYQINMRWTLKPKPSEELKHLATALNVEDFVATLLVQRGINTFEEAKHFRQV
jgi:hypothetical protein